MGTSSVVVGDDSMLPAMQISQDGAGYGLVVSKPDDQNFAIRVDAWGHGLLVQQSHDFAGADNDLVNLYHRSTGDGIYGVHLGGRPPGYAGAFGGNCAINLLIPQYLDDTTARRAGTVVNDRMGMTGLRVEAQAPNEGVRGLHVVHWGGGPAVEIVNQFAGYPQGQGMALCVVHHGASDGVRVEHYGPGTNATLKLVAYDVVTRPALDIRDGSNWHGRFTVSALGVIKFGTGYAPEDTVVQRGSPGMLVIANAGAGTSGLVLGTEGDVSLWRDAADVLRTDNRLQIRHAEDTQPALETGLHSSPRCFRIMPMGEIDFGDGAGNYDVRLRRNAPGQLGTEGRFCITRPTNGDLAFLVWTPNSVQYKLIVTGDGTHWWSNGQVDVDTNLYRAAANHLRTDDLFSAAGLSATSDAAGVVDTVTLTNVHNAGTPRGAGVGTIHFADGTDRDCAGFLKMKIGTADYFVPLFAASEAPLKPAGAVQAGRTAPVNARPR